MSDPNDKKKAWFPPKTTVVNPRYRSRPLRLKTPPPLSSATSASSTQNPPTAPTQPATEHEANEELTTLPFRKKRKMIDDDSDSTPSAVATPPLANIWKPVKTEASIARDKESQFMKDVADKILRYDTDKGNWLKRLLLFGKSKSVWPVEIKTILLAHANELAAVSRSCSTFHAYMDKHGLGTERMVEDYSAMEEEVRAEHDALMERLNAIKFG